MRGFVATPLHARNRELGEWACSTWETAVQSYLIQVITVSPSKNDTHYEQIRQEVSSSGKAVFNDTDNILRWEMLWF